MSEQPDTRLLLTCADLLSGAEALAYQREHGQPELLRKAGCEDPGTLLLAVCDLVQPSDLPGGWGPLWGAAVRLWRSGRNATLEQAIGGTSLDVRTSAESALRFVREHGMGVSQKAPEAAQRILGYRAAELEMQQARESAAKAEQARRAAFDGVV